jgi:predicted lipoprotein with Yx(FWY)xxD motif
MSRIGSLLIVPAIAVALLLAACGSSSPNDTQTSTGGGDTTVSSASNATLGQTILVDAEGMTLYRLSGEKGGHWICTTKACLAEWHPVTGAPTGAKRLDEIKRPDGTEQVAYKGMPLYTFDDDEAPGDAKGDGFKDVGTWNAVTTNGAAAQPPATTSSSGPYGY